MLEQILKKKKKGVAFIILVIAIFAVSFVFLVAFTVFTSFKISNQSDKIKTSLVLSNLAIFNPQNINMDLLSESPSSNVIMIKDPNSALTTWKTTLEDNLYLDGNFKPLNSSSFIKSKVDIKDFIIYNVNNKTNDITEYTLNPNTMLFDSQDYPGGKGVVKTPKGITVNVTTIFSNVGFTINEYANVDTYVTVNKSDGAYKSINNTKTNVGGNN